MTSKSEKNEISVKLKGLQEEIASFTRDITSMKAIEGEIQKFNELMAKSRKLQTKLNEALSHKNYEVLIVKKDLEEIL